MNIMFTLWGPQPCVKQGQVDSGAPAFNHSAHHLLGAHEEPGPHRGPCKKSDTLVHFRRGPRGLDTYKWLANAPPPLPVETTPFFPELIIAYSLQIALLDFLWVCFQRVAFRARASPHLRPRRNYSTNTFTAFSERSSVCLSRYDSHTATFTIVKGTVQWFSVYSQGREFNVYCCLLQEHFHYPVRKSLTHQL